MPVAMVDGLPRDDAAVDHGVRSLGTDGGDNGTSESREQRAGVGRQIGREVAELRVMIPREDQDVTLDDRIDVQDDNRLICPQDASRRDLTGNNLAEDAIRVATHARRPRPGSK